MLAAHEIMLQQQRNWFLVERWKVPTAFVSYEKLILHPGLFIEEMAAFLSMPMPEAALVRELKEELSINVNPADLDPITFASHGYADFHLLMPLFACRTWHGTPTPVEGQTLAWVAPTALADYPAPAADIPLFAVLASATSG
ncbi:MAG: NUDIX domain-containing protein [Pseudomonadota bacterium]